MVRLVAIATLLILNVNLIPQTRGYKFFQDRIPNGAVVSHPCKGNLVWNGVGHMNPQGGGARNPFGQAFEKNGLKWTTDLCMADSDGDGKTNGFELGDPDCKWTEGGNPFRVVNITHPGFCDPIGSDACKSKNNTMCDYGSFKCEAAENEKDVRNMTIRITNTEVPAQETTYMCQYIELPSDETYDIISTEPLITNQDVMHHMIVWGCQGDWHKDRYSSPRPCGMAPQGCNNWIIGWTLGNNGHCFSKDVGVRIGKGGWKYVILQSHWNNPQLRKDYYDNSGFLLKYTPILRKEAESTIILGSVDFTIPPGKKQHTEVASLHRDCSRINQKTTLKFHTVLLHMHYMGTSAKLEHFRDGVKLREIGDQQYSYDSPVIHQFDPPIEYAVGDELKLTCVFDSSKKTNETKWGDATSDEMCYAFIGQTPFQTSMSVISQTGDLETCSAYHPDNGGSVGKETYMGFIGDTMCHATGFTLFERPYYLRKIKAHCNNTSDPCNVDCVKHLKVLKMHPCSTSTSPSGRQTVIDFINDEVTEEKFQPDVKYADEMIKTCLKDSEQKPTNTRNNNCLTSMAAVNLPTYLILVLMSFVFVFL